MIKPNDMTEKEQIKYVKQSYINIQNVKYPSEKVQIAAVRANIFSIRFIKNPIEQVQLYAVEKNGWLLGDILKNSKRIPSKKVQKISFKNFSYTIIYLKNPKLKFQKKSLYRTLSFISCKDEIEEQYYIRKPKYKHLMKLFD